MSIKDKIVNSICVHPRLTIFGIGLAVTFAVGMVLGLADNSQAYAFRCEMRHGECV